MVSHILLSVWFVWCLVFILGKLIHVCVIFTDVQL